MRIGLALGAIVLSSCASTRLPNTQTAAEQFSVLDCAEKGVARRFYDLGSGDAIKRLYWAQRNLQQYKPRGDVQGSSSASLQRRYVTVPVPAHQDPDGTQKEASYQTVEIVQ